MEVDKPYDVEEVLILFKRFLDGIQINKFAPSGFECFDEVSFLSKDFNYTGNKWDEAKEDGSKDAYRDAVFNTTTLISGTLANSIGSCFSTVYELIIYSQTDIAQFKDFNDWM